jgi:hypothetical protein
MMPASLSFVAFTITITRIVRSPCGLPRRAYEGPVRSPDSAQ